MRITLLIALMFTLTASAAAASSWPKDPRVCSNWVSGSHPLGSPYQRSHCAGDAAKAAVKAHAGDGSITCTQAATMLRWTCVHSNGTTYRVAFSYSKRHWWVLVTP